MEPGSSSRWIALPDGNWWLKVRVPPELDRYMIHKGSITLDGVSLTIASLDEQCRGSGDYSVYLRKHCDRKLSRAGTRINVEVDLVGKYVEKFLVSRFSFLVGGGRGSSGDSG